MQVVDSKKIREIEILLETYPAITGMGFDGNNYYIIINNNNTIIDFNKEGSIEEVLVAKLLENQI